MHPFNVSVFMAAKDTIETIKAEWDEVHALSTASGYGDYGSGDGNAVGHPLHAVIGSGIGSSGPKVRRRPPQIRTSPIKVYGSSGCGFVTLLRSLSA